VVVGELPDGNVGYIASAGELAPEPAPDHVDLQMPRSEHCYRVKVVRGHAVGTLSRALQARIPG
jgi:hypothetical protein